MDNGRIMKELKELQEGVKNVSHQHCQTEINLLATIKEIH
jgi:hypothetical protein